VIILIPVRIDDAKPEQEFGKTVVTKDRHFGIRASVLFAKHLEGFFFGLCHRLFGFELAVAFGAREFCGHLTHPHTIKVF
jgi:hypothetical protein